MATITVEGEWACDGNAECVRDARYARYEAAFSNEKGAKRKQHVAA